MEIVREESRYALQEHLHLIAAPLQVIWGKQDQVIHDVWLPHVMLKLVFLCRFLLLIRETLVIYSHRHYYIPGCGCFRNHGHQRGVAWVQSGHSGKLRALCGDGETTTDSQIDPGVHHLAARCQEWHKEILLKHNFSPMQCFIFFVHSMARITSKL